MSSAPPVVVPRPPGGVQQVRVDRQAKIMVVKDIEREDIEFISKILGVEAAQIRNSRVFITKSWC